jgi:pyruvate, water dikinase
VCTADASDRHGVMVCWLGDPACRDAAAVGSKVANLSWLAADLPVPPGFCLSLASAADATWAALERPFTLAYARLGERCGQPDPPVAVRSSAVDEDSPGASFAGQHATVLNVSGAPAGLQAVLACLESFVSEQARAYRRRRGLATAPERSAVLVQQFMPADVSAVLFSANPVTGSRDEIVVTASWGLGPSIVGGTVTPDTFVLRRGDLRIVRRQPGEKRRMTIPVPGGVREVDVPRRLWHPACLDDARLGAMAHLGLEVEARMGWPVDLELVWRGAAFYLLQCRPVTALPD